MVTPLQETFADYGIVFDARQRPDADGIIRTHCPKCSPTSATPTDCLTVWTETGTWSCNKCGWGHGHKLRTKVDVKYLEAPRNIKSEDCPEARAWLIERGISPATIERNHITFQYGKTNETHVVCFWYMVSGKPVNIKYRTTDKQMFQESNAARVLYKIDDIRDGAEECIICEGEIDALSFEEAGYANAVSVPDGAPDPKSKKLDKKFAFLDGWQHVFAPMERVYIAVDNDAPGLTLQAELIRRIGKEKCYLVSYPDGCKDANDVLRQHGAIVLQECIKRAYKVPTDGAVAARSAFASLNALYEHDFPDPPITNLGDLDDYITFLPGMMTVVTGVPGSGKSTWLDYVLLQLYLHNPEVGMRHAVFTPENKALEIHQMRLVEQLTGKAFLPRYRMQYVNKETGEINKAKYLTPEVLRYAQGVLDDAFHYIHSTTAGFSVDRLLEAAKYWVEERGVRTLTIDPWNKIEHSYGAKDSLKYISAILNQLLYFAGDKKVHLFLVAHPKKMTAYEGGVDDQHTYQRPSLYDISGSADFFNMTDNGIIVHRANTDGEDITEVTIDKIKHKFMGKRGKLKFHFDPETQRFGMAWHAQAWKEAQDASRPLSNQFNLGSVPHYVYQQG